MAMVLPAMRTKAMSRGVALTPAATCSSCSGNKMAAAPNRQLLVAKAK
jgi:hypothetical protein